MAFGVDACENVFAPDRARAGQCDTACGFCDAPAAGAGCTADEFVRKSALVTAACCTASTPCPDVYADPPVGHLPVDGGIPTTCTSACAESLLPFQRQCAAMLEATSLTAIVAAAAATCPSGAGSGH